MISLRIHTSELEPLAQRASGELLSMLWRAHILHRVREAGIPAIGAGALEGTSRGLLLWNDPTAEEPFTEFRWYDVHEIIPPPLLST